MLDKTDFGSWKQRIRLYCKGKDHGEYILHSIDEGLFKIGRCRDEIASGTNGPNLGPERDRVVANVSQAEKDKHRAEIHATNILLQGSKLTKDDRESQLYDEFEHYTRVETFMTSTSGFTKLINDMRHIKMTMPKIQLTSKGLKESNHDQLYAYLKQQELHANENKMLMKRLSQHSHDPLALVSNVSPYQYPSSSSVPPQPSYISPNGRVVVQNVQGRHNRIQGNNARGVATAARNCIQPKRPQNSDYFKEKILLMQAQENGVDLDEEQLLFLVADQCDAFNSDVDKAPTAQTMFMANLSSANLVYDKVGPSYDSDTLSEDNEDQVVHSDVSFVPNDAVMIITNDIYEQDAPCVPSNNTANASQTAKLARYKLLAKVYEKRAQFELTEQELMIDTQIRMIIKDRNVKEESLQKELHSVKMQLNSTLNHNKLIREEVSTLKQDFKQKENNLLEEFLDMKHLKEKVEDKLYKQDQSLQNSQHSHLFMKIQVL
ncbi:hypothetical protein Tco_0271431 [Tanacetum coccineum]